MSAFISWLAQFLLMLTCLVHVPWIMLLAVWLQDPVTGRMPAGLRWLETYDDLRASQGMYETAVADVYALCGWRVKQWYWLGWRNQAYTLFFRLAPSINYQTVDFSATGAHGNLGTWAYKAVDGGRAFYEFGVSFKWSATKKCTLGVGWKLFSVESFLNRTKMAGPLDRPLFYLQVHPWSTI